MAMDKNKTGRVPQDDATDRDHHSRIDPGSPRRGSWRAGQLSSTSRNSQRIDDDDEEDDMDFRPGRPMGGPRYR